MELCEELTDRYHYDPYFEVTDVEQLEENEISIVCKIKSNASGDILKIIAST